MYRQWAHVDLQMEKRHSDIENTAMDDQEDLHCKKL